MRQSDVRIRTPEQVELTFTLAGIGSRAIAQLIDVSLLLLFYTAVSVAFIFWGRIHLFGGITSYFIGFAIVSSFLVFWAYFVLLEYFGSGQTLGKRWVGIRVIHFDGRPTPLFASLVRNLLRLVDFLPMGYLTGLVVMLADKTERRVGDIAGGTLVVVDQSQVKLSPILQPNELKALPDGEASAGMTTRAFVRVKKHRFEIVIAGELPDEWKRALTEFNRRQSGLSGRARMELAVKLWQGISSLSAVRLQSTQGDVELNPKEVTVLMVKLARIVHKGRG